MAKDALAGVYDIDIDSVYYDTIHENQEYNIDPGATANDPPTVTLGPIHADMIKPIVRLQVLEVEDPIQRPTTWPGTPTSTTITQASGKTYIGTRFHAGASRYGFIGFEGVTDAAWDYLIVREGRYTGEPDLADVVYQKLNNAAIPGGGSHGILFSVDPGFRLNRGQPYWILIRPNNTGAAYNFTFYSSQPSTTNPGATGQGVISYHFPTTSWIWEQRDEVGHMIITQMKWTDVREGSQWTLVNQAGTAIIEFGGSEGFAPYWIYDSGASEYQNGARAFFFEGWVSGVELYLPLIDMIENKAQMVLSAPEGSDVPLIDAIESKVGQIIRRLMTENNWHIRQLHRYTDYPDYGAPVVWYVNPFLPVYLAKRPPAVRAELLSSSWTPVLSLKYGPDSTNPDEEARVIVHGLREEISTAYTSSRLLAKTVGDKIIFAEYHNHDLQLDLNGLQNKFTGFPTPFFKKVHLVKIADVPNFDELMALAERQSDLENLVLISGSLQVDGSTWVQPGDRITYETSRYGITPAAEFLVTAVEYLPNLMVLSLTSSDSSLDKIIRKLNYDIQRFQGIQSITLSDLEHTFYAYGQLEDDSLATSSQPLIAKCYDAATPTSSWVEVEEVAGPTINGYASKILSAYFPAEGGQYGHGKVTRVRVREDLLSPGADDYVNLEHVIYHWDDNGVSVCLFIYHS